MVWGGLMAVALWDVTAARSALLVTALVSGAGTGLVVFGASRWVYRQALPVRIAWAALTLFVAAGLLGACVGWATAAWPLGPLLGLALMQALSHPIAWTLIVPALANHEWLRALDLSAEAAEPTP